MSGMALWLSKLVLNGYWGVWGAQLHCKSLGPIRYLIKWPADLVVRCGFYAVVPVEDLLNAVAFRVQLCSLLSASVILLWDVIKQNLTLWTFSYLRIGSLQTCHMIKTMTKESMNPWSFITVPPLWILRYKDIISALSAHCDFVFTGWCWCQPLPLVSSIQPLSWMVDWWLCLGVIPIMTQHTVLEPSATPQTCWLMMWYVTVGAHCLCLKGWGLILPALVIQLASLRTHYTFMEALMDRCCQTCLGKVLRAVFELEFCSC